ncbi:hypothetical protein [Novosphingobium sp. JCM 18896]|uniref:hypothetical protein n=1 Tax=Novosphingobium sp. JCM 18896 TaxID=2989731 RepID=UPI002223858F|nr:hypothetical protein [Novosphingobium sp. JCM 18896]MCW1432288.1 hypothetical protein [Novosphingobium sp. JCM 18896]
MKRVLLIGGSAATGRAIIEELHARQCQVTIYNRGRHNADLDARDIEFIIGDPHFRESIEANLSGREWDIAIATYGRTRYLAEALAGRCGHFIGISGTPVCRTDLGSPTRETDPPVRPDGAPASMLGIIPRIVETERRILDLGGDDAFASTIVRYPYVYGPHSLVPMEWHVMKRVLDGRTRWALPDGGLFMTGRCASANAAALIGSVIDNREVANGKIYHAADQRQFTQREWVSLIAGLLGHEFEFVDLPPSIAALGSSAVPLSGEMLFSHSKQDLAAGRLRHNQPSPLRAQVELGYQEAVDPIEWIQRTVEYWQSHPYEIDATGSGPLTAQDFDYAAEDALLGWWDDVLRNRPSFGETVHRGHPYEHPKTARP